MEESTLEVYWRPGCSYCARLFRALDAAGITYRLRNIWEDDDARRFVRAHNRGNEVVPTVVYGPGVVASNPDPAWLVSTLLGGRAGLGTAPPAEGR